MPRLLLGGMAFIGILIIGAVVFAVVSAFRSSRGQGYRMSRKMRDNWMHQQQELMRRQMDEDVRRMNDPYETPGVDMIVDEAHHGIDHGLGMANQDQP